MVNDTVAFEQRDFVHRIADGWDPSEAYTWLSTERQIRGRSSGASAIIPAIIDTIVQDSDYLSPTFTLDYTRLRSIQAECRNLRYQAACIQAFEAVLKSLKCKVSLSQSLFNDLFARITTLISDKQSDRERSQVNADVALEVVRQAYTACKITRVPSPSDLKHAEHYLEKPCALENSDFENPETSLSDKLSYLVEHEVDVIGNFSPAQIMNHYKLEDSTKVLPDIVNEQTELLRLARRIAHITVLHWRVWAPLVYKEPVGGRFADLSLTSASLGESPILELPYRQRATSHEHIALRQCRRDCASELKGGV